MRNIFIIACLLVVVGSCKKDKFNTEPQIKYKSVNPNYVSSTQPNAVIPEITFSITDKEGDIGFKLGDDTAYVCLRNMLTGDFDSLPFPDLGSAGKSNFEADVSVSVEKVLKCRPIPGGGLHVDTLFFEVYVRDFAGNKSNVILTGDPIYFNCR